MITHITMRITQCAFSRDFGIITKTPTINNVSGKISTFDAGVFPKTRRRSSSTEVESKTPETITVGVQRPVFWGS